MSSEVVMEDLGRDIMLRRLRQDLIGPDEEHEAIKDRPSDVYLTGILWPQETAIGAEAMESMGVGNDDGETGGEEDEVPMTGCMRPCVAGVSFVIEDHEPFVDIDINTALYEEIEDEEGEKKWHRNPIKIKIPDFDCRTKGPFRHEQLPVGTYLYITSAQGGEQNTLVGTVTFINGAQPEARTRRGIESITLFQFNMRLTPSRKSRFVAHANRRPSMDEDDRSAALLFRNAKEFAVGHTCSATWADVVSDTVAWISTEWIPTAVVAGVKSQGDPSFENLSKGPDFPLKAAWLAHAEKGDLLRGLKLVASTYRDWIELQRRKINGLIASEDIDAANRNLLLCSSVADRLDKGAEEICSSPDLIAAFRFTNLIMNVTSGWSRKGAELVWYPFQLAFLLLAAPSTVNKEHDYRRTMDLLWFPTGGGKTEAYLALIAFVSFVRRIRAHGKQTGTAAIMRYTLRLLTTQQFLRATAMILAAEALRLGKIDAKDDIKSLGTEPFSIGLWVGGDATPNQLQDALRTLNAVTGVTARQIDECPCCRSRLDWRPAGPADRPTGINVKCLNPNCQLHGLGNSLPVYTVDQLIYASHPTLLIGTVDKFAQVVRKGECGPLFGARGDFPPDLIIQDELHLISGPLGSLMGLYEAGIDRMMWKDGVPPKVIGSTATIRKAAEQVKSLFNRELCQFPPSAIDAGDSGFAVLDEDSPGRLYAGITTAGRSAKFSLQAVSGSLLQSGAAGFDEDELRDPYWTLMVYFNSLRELGGAVVLMQDDVPDAIKLYGRRRRELFRGVRSVEELTSRISQNRVKEMLGEMSIPATEDEALTAVLATNMLSVGVDIPRLGLMVVNGQPKGIAEYIQATSRVGRRHPGLIVSILNNSKSRDRSHYETFRTWHQTLYRDVEATSVTPFASRARDRALHAALIAAARHLVPGMSDSPALDDTKITQIKNLISDIAARGSDVDVSETAVHAELERFLLEWRRRGPGAWWNDYKPATSLLVSYEHAAALRAQDRDARGAKATPNSMRNVEAGVPFRLISGLARNTGDE